MQIKRTMIIIGLTPEFYFSDISPHKLRARTEDAHLYALTFQ